MALIAAAEALGQALADKYDRGAMLTGIVTNTNMMQERSLVEVQLATGSYINAFAWTQASIGIGDDVVVGRIQHLEGTVYTVVAVNAPPASLNFDTQPTVTLWGGPTFRPPRIPDEAGKVELLLNTQQMVLFGFDTFVRMRVDLRFSVPPIGDKLEYWLYAYDPSNVDFTAEPPWSLKIGTSWKSLDGTIWRTVFDMSAPGYLAEWIDDYDQALFVIALKRVSTAITRASSSGRISFCHINFFDSLEMDPLEMRAEPLMTIDVAPIDFIGVAMTADFAMEVYQYWDEAAFEVYVEPSVLGPYAHS